jgi:signal transduction histidine kinase/NO-binding membrane sensor protein with MHYT domain/CheY-like chemotaxis protein
VSVLLTVLTCLTTEHDWRLVVVAGVVCLTGMLTMLRLLSRAPERAGQERWTTLAIAGVIAGAAIWSTHFIGMLAYQPGVPIEYHLWPTLASFGLAITGAAVGLWTASLRGRLAMFLGGSVLGATTAAMHFVGMSGVRVQGLMSWDVTLTVAAVVLTIGLFAGAFVVLGGGSWRRTLLAGGLAALAVCVLHFTAMSAITLTLDPTAALPVGSSDTRIAIGVAMISSLIVGAAGAVGLLAIWSRGSVLAQLREAIDAMPDGMGFYDARDRLVIWNARYAELNPEAAPVMSQGMRFRDLLQFELNQGYYPEAEGRHEEWLEERMAARQRLSCTLEQVTADGRWLRVQDRRTSDGGIVTLVNDITDLKDDARALSQARDAAETANRAKSEFLANMSHEIRTPLNGVIGVAQALEQTPLNTEQAEMLGLIRSSGETLQHLLSDILDLARVESGRMTLRTDAFDLAKAVNEAAQLYAASAQEKGLQFFVEIDEAAHIWVEGDITRLKQILTNLVSNAVKFTSTGFVSLTVTPCSTGDGQSAFRFTVEDTGIGFDNAASNRLFDRFEQADGTITRRFGGTGLGLAICRQLAGMMKGSLDCESEPGGGSAFILTIPLPQTDQRAETNGLRPDQGPDRRLTVLLADDHPTNRKVVELILAHSDIDLTMVEDGAQAVEACRARAFDVILMDMQMPVMDGLTATREIRLHEAAMGTHRTPLVMLTANALPEHILAAERAGADRHLAKPFNASELIKTVSELARARDAALAA